MKVLMLGWEFPPRFTGGLGIACAGLTSALNELGVEVHLLLPFSAEAPGGGANTVNVTEAGLSEGLRPSRVRITRLPSQLSPYLSTRGTVHPLRANAHGLSKPTGIAEDSFAQLYGEHDEWREIAHEMQQGSEAYGNSLLHEVFRYADLVAALQLNEFSLIHAHDWMTFPAAIALARATGKPLIVHLHSSEIDRSGEEGADHRVCAIERAGMRAAQRVIAVSNYTGRHLVERYGIAPRKIRVIHNGCTARGASSSSFQALRRRRVVPPAPRGARRPYGLATASLQTSSNDGNEKNVLFLGRITMQKGPEYFVHAAKLVAEKMPHVRFVMAGTGDMLRPMIHQIADSRLQTRFHFTGFVDQARVATLLSATDLIVIPSVSEPFGLVAMEAAHHQVPIIISRTSGVREVLPNTIGVDFWDVKKIAHNMLALLHYPVLARTMTRANGAALNAATWERAARAVVDEYQGISYAHTTD